MPTLTLDFSQGRVASRDIADLRPGELQTASGMYYKPGDPKRIWNQAGPSAFGDTGSGAKTHWVGVAQYDSGTDRVLAWDAAAGKIYSATPGATGTFAALKTGLSTSATKASMCHAFDRQYWCDGYDRNQVIESDGTVRPHGMLSPDEKPAVTLTDGSAGAATARPTATISNSGWTNPGSAWDADTGTYAHASLATAGGTASIVVGTFGADATAGRRLEIVWRLTGLREEFFGTADTGGPYFGIGGTTSAGYKVAIAISYSINSGSTFTTLYSGTHVSALAKEITTVIPVTANSNLIQVKATMTYVLGTNPATLHLYDVRTAVGSARALFDTTTGLYYAIAEYDATRGLPSPAGPASDLLTGSSVNLGTVPLPSAAKNSTTTHFIIYRTYDGGTTPSSLGQIALVPVSQAGGNYLDSFDIDKDTPATPLYPLVTVQVEDGTIRVPRDSAPPSFQFMTTFKGRVLGISRNDPRALYGSYPGRPESFPEINLISSFPFPEHDQLVAGVEVGDIFLIGAQQLMIVLTDFPEVVQGVFNAARVIPLRGAPGLVSQYAITAYTIAGEPRAAFVSPFGVYITNGASVERISDDMDWVNDVSQSALGSCSLTWDPDRLVLVFNYTSPSGSDNDKQVLFHMAPEHAKANGKPKITGPTPRTVSHMAGALVSGTYRMYSADNADGYVYLEEGGSGLAGTVRSGRLFSGAQLWQAIHANLRHTNFGTTATATVTWTTGRDAPSKTNSDTLSMSLSGADGDEIYVGRTGEWHDVQIDTAAGIQGGFLDLRVESRTVGGSGTRAA